MIRARWKARVRNAEGTPRAPDLRRRGTPRGGEWGGRLRGGSSGQDEFMRISANSDKFTTFSDKFTAFFRSFESRWKPEGDLCSLRRNVLFHTSSAPNISIYIQHVKKNIHE